MVRVCQLDGSVVLERTSAGQQALLAPSMLLGHSAQRLLSMVTGYTDMATLAGLWGDDLHTVSSVAQELILKGLMHVVDEHAQPAPRPVAYAVPSLVDVHR